MRCELLNVLSRLTNLSVLHEARGGKSKEKKRKEKKFWHARRCL